MAATAPRFHDWKVERLSRPNRRICSCSWRVQASAIRKNVRKAGLVRSLRSSALEVDVLGTFLLLTKAEVFIFYEITTIR
jgi:hypothetical protein